MKKTNCWEDIVKEVKTIVDTADDYYVECAEGFPKYTEFASSGLTLCGQRLHFPADFLRTIAVKHPITAEHVLRSRADDYFRENPTASLLIRTFFGEIYGVLTDKYSIFDDDEVTNLLSSSEYLMNACEIWSDISPTHFHVRFISGNKLYVDGDDSPLSMAVFVDNSMVGSSALKIRFGIYRWACTNGAISGLKEFTILREVHHGEKEWEAILSDALNNIGDYEKSLLDMVEQMVKEDSAIFQMDEEGAIRYLKEKLNVGKKQAKVVYECYLEYGGKTRWDLCNAITDVAHNFENIENRLFFEERALQIS